MTTQTNFFATRTLARNAVQDLNGTFKDFGKDAPTGERWAVLVEVAESVEDVQAVHEEHISSQEATRVLNQPAAIIAEQNLKTQNNKPVRVLFRRSHQAIRLAKHLDRTR